MIAFVNGNKKRHKVTFMLPELHKVRYGSHKMFMDASDFTSDMSGYKRGPLCRRIAENESRAYRGMNSNLDKSKKAGDAT